MMRGLALADWLVNTTSRALGAHVSRRGFIAKTTMVGTAVAATGCAVVTQPGPPFQRITDCRGGLCRDGYTEFCCVINQGVNACPPGSIASGWWRADYSVYCDGTRYYIDCNDFSGYAPCGCAAGCDTRKVYCNHFRYGQCNQWVGGTGVIACRMVTCVPPYALDIGCGGSSAVDNATAGHNADCAAYTPPAPPPPPPKPLIPTPLAPSLGGAVSLANGTVDVFVRGSDGAIHQQSFDGANWAAGWLSLGGSVKSTISAISPAAGEIELVVRADDRSAAVQRFTAGAGSTTWESLGGTFTSSVVAATRGSVVHVVGRGTDNAMYTRRWNGSTWSPWEWLGGSNSTDPVLALFGTKLYLLARHFDGGIWQNVYTGSWSGWNPLGGWLTSDLTVAVTPTEIHVFARAEDTIAYTRHNAGPGYTNWEGIGGLGLNSDPVAVADGAEVSLFGRAGDQSLWHVRRQGPGWGPWESLSLEVTSDPVAVSDGIRLWVFAQGTDDSVQYTQIEAGVWSGSWTPVPGLLTAAPVSSYP